MPAILPAQANVDLSALHHNLTQVRARLPIGCDILAVVKADAYGHGAHAIAKTLQSLHVMRFGVATLEEGICLREAGISQQILVMGALFPEQVAALVAHDLTPVICDSDLPRHLASVVDKRSAPYLVHIKIDTGMGRLGLPPETVLPLLQSSLCRGPLRVEGLMTHLADADNEDPAYTADQLSRLGAVTAQIERAGISIPLIHAANSAAILTHPIAHQALVRPGLILYGYPPTSRLGRDLNLKPVLTLQTRIAQIRHLKAGESVSYGRTYVTSRPSRIAVLPIGYADGYNRALSNRGSVLVKGRRAQIVGRICMDMTMVDITDIEDATMGDIVTLIGQQGEERITAADLAACLNTIPYEILCTIGPRIPRIYSNGPTDLTTPA